MAGSGYLLPPVDGLALFGASSQPGDDDPSPRASDHAFNLQRLTELSPQALPSPHELLGRVGWRCTAADRLPLVGTVPDEDHAAGERLQQLPRRQDLHLFTALGSRGIAWSLLGAQVLAAQISGAPMPLEGSLVDALDPARLASGRAPARRRG